MRMSRASRIRAVVRVLIGFAIAAGSVVGVVKPTVPAFAQTAPAPLTADQVAAVQGAVQTAIADIDPNLRGAERAQALSQALAQIATAELNLDGAGALAPVINAAISAGVPVPQVLAPIMPVAANFGIPTATAVDAITLGAVSAGASPTQTAQAIIAIAQQNSVNGAAVGNGLGQAAAALSSANSTAATQIAVVVSNEGTLGTGQAFGQSVVTSGGSQQLASAGQQNPGVGSTIGATNTNANTGAVTTNTVVTTATNEVATISLATGASQQISAVGTTITCTTPSCN
jgi:hypothetical protein